MLWLDVLIATLVLVPWAGPALALAMPDAALDLSDYGLPLLIAGLAAAALLRRSRERWAGLSVAAVLAALMIVVPRLESDIAGYGLWMLTHGMGSIGVVAISAVALRHASGEPWQASFFIRQATRLAAAWGDAIARSSARTLWTAAAVVGTQYLYVALLRHQAFESHGFDLGIFTNAMWNLTHGNGYFSSVKGGINLFADHQSPLFWLLAPLFWLVPRPETLLFAQAYGLAAGGPALFYLGRAHFGREHWAPAALPWLYWCYLPLRNANAFDFHPEVFMLPLFLWAFAGFASEKRWAKVLGALALLGALGAKESAGVVLFGIGVAYVLTYGAQSARARWAGVALALAGVALFFFDVKVVPRLLGVDYDYTRLYKRFGGDIVDLLVAPLVRPGDFFSQLVSPERLKFLFWTLAPLGFLPLFNWRAVLAAAPPYVMLFLSEGEQRVRIVFHYGIEPACALFWALPLGLAAFARRYGWQRTGLWMLFWAVAAFGPGQLIRPLDYEQRLAADVMPCVSSDVSIAASDALIPHLATRAWISYPYDLREQPADTPVRCVVTDLRVGSNWPLGRFGTARVLEELPGRGYREAWSCRSFSVYAFDGASCLKCAPVCH